MTKYMVQLISIVETNLFKLRKNSSRAFIGTRCRNNSTYIDYLNDRKKFDQIYNIRANYKNNHSAISNLHLQ